MIASLRTHTPAGIIWISTATLLLICVGSVATGHRHNVKKAKKKQQSCQQDREETEEFYGNSVQDEDKMRELCPQQICSACYKRIHDSRRKVKNSTKYDTVKVQPEKWTNDGNTLSEQQGWKTVLCANNIRREVRKRRCREAGRMRLFLISLKTLP